MEMTAGEWEVTLIEKDEMIKMLQKLIKHFMCLIANLKKKGLNAFKMHLN